MYDESLSTFVLIHGGWHAAWCWSKITGLLKRKGHQVIAPDLPAHGADPTPLTAKPYEMYVPRVCEILDALPVPAVLVGHSSGGMIIDEVARRRSDNVQSLVFLSAFLLPLGKTPRDVMAMDEESILRDSLEIDVARGVSSVKKEFARSVFYEDCSDEDAEWAIRQLQPEPLIPPGLSTSNTLPNPSPSGVSRFYIECLRDRALGPRTQKWMYTETPCDTVYSLNTSHSPFLSAPVALSEYLMEIADRTASVG
jgi:pimeloyl-ACP methyl ester carboxylesterase